MFGSLNFAMKLLKAASGFHLEDIYCSSVSGVFSALQCHFNPYVINCHGTFCMVGYSSMTIGWEDPRHQQAWYWPGSEFCVVHTRNIENILLLMVHRSWWNRSDMFKFTEASFCDKLKVMPGWLVDAWLHNKIISTVVMTCADICSDLIARNGITVKLIYHWTWWQKVEMLNGPTGLGIESAQNKGRLWKLLHLFCN